MSRRSRPSDLIADDFYRLVQSRFRNARIISGYGMTETTGLVTITRPMNRDEPTFQTIRSDRGRLLPPGPVQVSQRADHLRLRHDRNHRAGDDHAADEPR